MWLILTEFWQLELSWVYWEILIVVVLQMSSNAHILARSCDLALLSSVNFIEVDCTKIHEVNLTQSFRVATTWAKVDFT